MEMRGIEPLFHLSIHTKVYTFSQIVYSAGTNLAIFLQNTGTSLRYASLSCASRALSTYCKFQTAVALFETLPPLIRQPEQKRNLLHLTVSRFLQGQRESLTCISCFPTNVENLYIPKFQRAGTARASGLAITP